MSATSDQVTPALLFQLKTEIDQQLQQAIKEGAIELEPKIALEEASTIIQKTWGKRDAKSRNHYSANLVYWFNIWLNDAQFFDMLKYKDLRQKPLTNHLPLVAEGTFWSVHFGLSEIFSNMNFAEIYNLDPITETGGRLETERTALMKKVISKLTFPIVTFEDSYAVRQAAWACYVKKHSYDVVKEQERLYNMEKPLKSKL